MSDFDRRLARALADDLRAPDEKFVLSVHRLVASSERARRVRLTALTGVAIALASIFGYGLSLTLSAWRAIAVPDTQVDIAPLLAVVLAICLIVLVLPLASAKK